jgi:hypothetical protein
MSTLMTMPTDDDPIGQDLQDLLALDDAHLEKLLQDLRKDGFFDWKGPQLPIFPEFPSLNPIPSPSYVYTDNTACTHPNLKPPEFDPVQAAHMSASEVRKRYPRGNFLCGQCGSSVITYASAHHFIAGDW